MKRRKNLIFPLLTLLSVVIAALVPQQLSALRDAGLAGSVHTEPLSGENNFSLWAPDLSERIRLAADLNTGASMASAVYQQLEGENLREAEERALEQLAALEQTGILPPGVVPEQLSYSSGERVYLWTPENPGGAGFLHLGMEDTGRAWFARVLLDEASGKIVHLEMDWLSLRKYSDPPSLIGSQMLDYLGLRYTLRSTGENDSVFSLEEVAIDYLVSRSGYSLLIAPTKSIDDTATDADIDQPGALLPAPEQASWK